MPWKVSSSHPLEAASSGSRANSQKTTMILELHDYKAKDKWSFLSSIVQNCNILLLLFPARMKWDCVHILFSSWLFTSDDDSI